MEHVDFVIVGGGIGGSALAGALARSGAEVVVLERETAFYDRIRGEWMAPWGVAELRRLGLYDRFMAAGGNHLTRFVGYDELFPPATAEANAIPIAELHPEVPGPLSMEHVVMQDEALAAAAEAGARVLRGVSNVTVRAGDAPGAAFDHDGARTEIGCRLLIGADGRASTVRRQLGFELVQDPIENLIAGLLIDDGGAWPRDLQVGGKAGDVHFLVFPQHDNQVRLYAEYATEQRGRFAGETGPQDMLDAFDVDCLPLRDVLSRSRPIGPCRSLPSQSSMVATPYAEGVVLIGDAAGYNDPIIGQGLSITARDARMVADALTSGAAVAPALFEDYAAERRERMRRLRAAALFFTALNARFEPVDVAKRANAHAHPELLQPILQCIFVGPETVADSDVFTDAYRERTFAA